MKKLIILLSLLVLNISLAQQKVYAPVPPANSAFVRVIHADTSMESMTAQIAEQSYEGLELGGISDYKVVAEGNYDVMLGSVTAGLEFSAGNYYSVAVANGEVSLLQDDINSNLAKTMLVLYNFSDVDAVDMKTADGSTSVVVGVAPQEMGNILVNPIQVDLAAFSAADAVDSFTGLSLHSGATYSMVVVGSSDALSANWVLNTVYQ